MQTKLTLRINKNVIDEVKRLAKRNNTSVSKMVENYFYHISGKGNSPDITDSPDLEGLTGIVHDTGSDEQIRNGYYDSKMRKHLKD